MHGIAWSRMESYGIAWNRMESYGAPTGTFRKIEDVGHSPEQSLQIFGSEVLMLVIWRRSASETQKVSHDRTHDKNVASNEPHKSTIRQNYSSSALEKLKAK